MKQRRQEHKLNILSRKTFTEKDYVTKLFNNSKSKNLPKIINKSDYITIQSEKTIPNQMSHQTSKIGTQTQQTKQTKTILKCHYITILNEFILPNHISHKTPDKGTQTQQTKLKK